MADDDKFSMHQEFPLDQVFKVKALERGFAEPEIDPLFDEWRDYWIRRPDRISTTRGWLQNWDGHLKRKAVRRSRVRQEGIYKPPAWRRQFEPRDMSPPVEREYRMFPYTRALQARQKARRGERLDLDDYRALREWDISH